MFKDIKFFSSWTVVDRTPKVMEYLFHQLGWRDKDDIEQRMKRTQLWVCLTKWVFKEVTKMRSNRIAAFHNMVKSEKIVSVALNPREHTTSPHRVPLLASFFSFSECQFTPSLSLRTVKAVSGYVSLLSTSAPASHHPFRISNAFILSLQSYQLSCPKVNLVMESDIDDIARGGNLNDYDSRFGTQTISTISRGR